MLKDITRYDKREQYLILTKNTECDLCLNNLLDMPDIYEVIKKENSNEYLCFISNKIPTLIHAILNIWLLPHGAL